MVRYLSKRHSMHATTTPPDCYPIPKILPEGASLDIHHDLCQKFCSLSLAPLSAGHELFSGRPGPCYLPSPSLPIANPPQAFYTHWFLQTKMLASMQNLR